jgi:hypothetical protein
MAAKEEEEEESLVFVQLSGVSSEDENFLEDFQGSSSFLKSSESSEVILQLGKYIFKGDIQDTPHTSLFFRKNAEQRLVSSYVCKTAKKMNLHRIYLRKKRPPGEREDLEDAPDSKVQKDAEQTTEMFQQGNEPDVGPGPEVVPGSQQSFGEDKGKFSVEVESADCTPDSIFQLLSHSVSVEEATQGDYGPDQEQQPESDVLEGEQVGLRALGGQEGGISCEHEPHQGGSRQDNLRNQEPCEGDPSEGDTCEDGEAESQR